MPPPRPPVPPVHAMPAKASAVVTAQGVADDAKVSTTVPGGIPVPPYAVERSGKEKETSFGSKEPLNVIRELIDIAPAGLLASLVGDIQDLSYAYMDADFLREVQAADQQQKGMLMGVASEHALGPALAQEISAYQAEKYTPRNATVYRDVRVGSHANELIVTTHAELLDGTNSRTGSWGAKWTLNVPSFAQAEMSGEVSTRAWCYEDTTAHMSATQSFQPTTVVADAENPESLAKAIMKQIKEWEKEVHEALTKMYGDEMDGTLRKIRRTLPITKTRLKWDLIAQRAVKSHEVKQKKKNATIYLG